MTEIYIYKNIYNFLAISKFNIYTQLGSTCKWGIPQTRHWIPRTRDFVVLSLVGPCTSSSAIDKAISHRLKYRDVSVPKWMFTGQIA